MSRNQKNNKPKKEKKTFKDVAYDILSEYDKGLGLHSKEITKIALEKGLLASIGSTPEFTMNSVMITDIKENDKKSRFIKRGPSRFSINSNWIPKKEKIKQISTHLSPVQKGDIAEARIAELITIYADQALTCYKPISDDEGIDLLVKKKKSSKTINIQVKSIWTKGGPVVTSVKEDRLARQNEIFIVFCVFDVDKGDLSEYVWLMSAKDFKKQTKHLKKRKDGRLVFVAGRGRRATNIWDKYLIDRRDLGNEILKRLKNKK